MEATFSESKILDLVGRIYDAAASPDLWPAFLEGFADTVGGTATTMFLWDMKDQSGNNFAMVRADPDFQQKYNEYYIGVDCFGIHGRKLITTGNVATGQMMCPDSILENSEFYQDFLRPMDVFHEFCGFIYQEQSVACVISTLRPKRAGPFEDRNLQLPRTLMPHLQRAVQLHRRITGLKHRTSAAGEALDRFPVGVVTIDQRGEVLTLNLRAKAILEQNDGLKLTRNGLVAARAQDTDRLRGLIQGAIASGAGKGLEPGGMILFPRPSRRRPFEVLVAPLRDAATWPWPDSPGAVIFLNDPETVPESKNRILARLFGLTTAEARLAEALMQGRSLEESAEEFRISRNTMRTQLQHLFDKTGTRRQAELVRLLSNSLAQLRFDSERF